MSMELDFPPPPNLVLLSKVRELSVVRVPATNSRYLVVKASVDDDWEDGTEDKEPIPVVVLSDKDIALIGTLHSLPKASMVILEPSTLRILSDAERSETDTKSSLTRQEKALVDSGEKIKAIKLIRERLGIGLKEAKDVADLYQSSWH